MHLKHLRVQGRAELHPLSGNACQQSATLCDDLPLRRAPLSTWAQALLHPQPPQALWGGLWPHRGVHCYSEALAWTEALQPAMPCTRAQDHSQHRGRNSRVRTWREGRTAGGRVRHEMPALDCACPIVLTGPQLISTCMQLPSHLGRCKVSGRCQGIPAPLACCAQQLEALSLALDSSLGGSLHRC